jgi:hypothetical protein
MAGEDKKFILQVFMTLTAKLETVPFVQKWFIGSYAAGSYQDLSMGVQLSDSEHLVIFYHHDKKAVSFKKLSVDKDEKHKGSNVEEYYTTYTMEGKGPIISFTPILDQNKTWIRNLLGKDLPPTPLTDTQELVMAIDTLLRAALAPGSIQFIRSLED